MLIQFLLVIMSCFHLHAMQVKGLLGNTLEEEIVVFFMGNTDKNFIYTVKPHEEIFLYSTEFTIVASADNFLLFQAPKELEEIFYVHVGCPVQKQPSVDLFSSIQHCSYAKYDALRNPKISIALLDLLDRKYQEIQQHDANIHLSPVEIIITE